MRVYMKDESKGFEDGLGESCNLQNYGGGLVLSSDRVIYRRRRNSCKSQKRRNI